MFVHPPDLYHNLHYGDMRASIIDMASRADKRNPHVCTGAGGPDWGAQGKGPSVFLSVDTGRVSLERVEGVGVRMRITQKGAKDANTKLIYILRFHCGEDQPLCVMMPFPPTSILDLRLRLVS